MATLKLPEQPGQRKLPWKVMLLVAALLAALAVGVMAATMLIGGSGSTPTEALSGSSAESESAGSENDLPWLIKPTPNAFGQILETEAMRRMAPYPVTPTPFPYVRDETRLSELPMILLPKDVAQMGGEWEEKVLQLLEDEGYLLLVQPSGWLDILIPLRLRGGMIPAVLLDAVDEWNKQLDKKERQAEMVPFLEDRVLTKR